MTEAKNIFTYQGRLYELAAGQSEALDASNSRWHSNNLKNCAFSKVTS